MSHLRVAVLALATILGFGVLARAQNMPSPEELKDNLSKKQSEEWIKKNPWITNYAKAKEAAKKAGKPIFAYFTRSYAY